MPGPAFDFEANYRQVGPLLYAWAELRIRPALRAQIDPQDLVQEVWLRAVRRQSSFDPALRPFRAWILQIAKNVLLESFRKLQRSPPLEAGLGPSTRLFVLADCPESITSFTQRLAQDEGVRRFLELAAGLDEEERQILVRCGLEGRTCADAARELELGEEALIKRWQRLRARLRESPWVASILVP